MLEVLASIASLIGLSMQVYDALAAKFTDDAGKYLSLFVVLTDTAQCWKQIHHKYQSLSNDMQALQRNIFLSDGLNVRTKHVSDIAPNQIRSIFESGALSDALASFEQELEPYLAPLSTAAALTEQQKSAYFRNIAKFGRGDLSLCMQAIVSAQNDTVMNHAIFCQFLQEIELLLQKDDWGHDEIKAVLKKKQIIKTLFDKNIKNADTALIQFLTIAKIVADEVR